MKMLMHKTGTGAMRCESEPKRGHDVIEERQEKHDGEKEGGPAEQQRKGRRIKTGKMKYSGRSDGIMTE